MTYDRLIDHLSGDSEVHAAETVARAIVVGIDFCASDTIPLTQLQQIQLVKAALMEFDGFRATAIGSMSMTATLIDMADGERAS